jgi:hypothetical protein
MRELWSTAPLTITPSMPLRRLLLLCGLHYVACESACRWTLRCSVGRQPGLPTSMPPAWGERGARLPFSVEVDVRSTPAEAQDVERLGEGACAIEPRTPTISITGFGGAMPIPVGGGGWRLEGSSLNFWLDFPEGTTRLADVGCDVESVWDLKPGVAGQCDVELPAGRLFFEMDQLIEDTALEQLNREFQAARALKWRAEADVATLEKRKNPAPVWNAARKEWVVAGDKVGFMEEQTARAAVASAEKAQREVDQRRPKRSELSREAGPWPGTGPGPVWMGRKGTLWTRRTGPLSGPFGTLPFGIGHHYTIVGTWSAEPMDPVETFWTMPE